MNFTVLLGSDTIALKIFQKMS